MSNIFENILKESLKNRIQNFNFTITDEHSLNKAFYFIIDTVKQMTQFFIEINDIMGY